MTWPSHGGQPKHILRLLGRNEAQDLIDFSANLNPLGPPAWIQETWTSLLQSAMKYPDPSYREAREAIATAEQIHPDQVLLTNGGAEAIYLAAGRIRNGAALIVHPTFSEYEQACTHYDVHVHRVYLQESEDFAFPIEAVLAKLPEVQAVFLCRPNNPTGTVVQEATLWNLLEEAERHEVLVIVDEAFADFMPEPLGSLTHWLDQFAHLILLRSMTKMFTIPGIRLGYALANKTLISAMKEDQIPWSVNSTAAQLAAKLAGEIAFVHKTQQWLQQEWKRLDATLKELAFFHTPSCVNFYLLQDPLAPELYHFLLEHGILARHTTNFPGLDHRKWLRLAVRSTEENDVLLTVLKKWKNFT